MPYVCRYLQQKDLVDFCRFHNIAFQAYSPLGSGDTNSCQTGPPPTGTIPLKDKLLLGLAEKYVTKSKSVSPFV